jgi:hypothetical protein
MGSLRHAFQVFVAVSLAVELAGSPAARSQTVPDTIADQSSIFIDGQTFKIIPGKPKPDAAEHLNALGGREVGPGAIIYRMGDALFIIGAPLVVESSSSTSPAGAAKLESGALDAKSDEQLGRLGILYEPPKNPELQSIYQRLRQHQVLETIQQILSPLRLPANGLLIKTLECGFPNSWYNDSDPGPTIHMCYELLGKIIKTTASGDVRPNITRHDAIVGQFLFWTLHETGHAVFDIFQMPLFGREEDAADLFAGYLMLQFGKDQARRWVEGAAYSAQEFMQDFQRADDYSDVHGLPQQRFYNLICLAYGADPVTFADVAGMMEQKRVSPEAQKAVSPEAKQGVLPKNRAEDCVYEFQSMDHAFKTQVGPHVDQAVAKMVMDRTWFPSAPKGRKVRATQIR